MNLEYAIYEERFNQDVMLWRDSSENVCQTLLSFKDLINTVDVSFLNKFFKLLWATKVRKTIMVWAFFRERPNEVLCVVTDPHKIKSFPYQLFAC